MSQVASVVVSESLTKRFGKLLAVDNLSFALEQGTITGFLGPNGAGKTTTLRMLLGLATPTSGRALIFDKPYAQLEQPALRVGAVLEATDFHPGRSGRDHLRTLSRAAELPDARADEALRLVELTAAASRRVKGYSLGMRQRLGLAAALLGDPELLVLDEPANGLDPEGVRWLRDFLRAFAAEGRTVLISSHVLAEVAQTVDQVLIINRGKLVTETSLDRLTARVGGAVRVRSPRLPQLAEALHREQIETSDDNGQLLAHGTSTDRVGDVAFAAGIPVHELVADGSSLEEVFLELTSERERVIAQTDAELLKIRSTRTTIGIVVGMVALILLFGLLSGLLTKAPNLISVEDQRGLLSVGGLAGVFSALAGIMLVTSEYRFGTIRPTFLFTPRRSLGGRRRSWLRGLLAGLAFGVVGEGLGFGIGYASLAGRGIDYALDGGQTALLVLGTLAGVALWGAIGVGLGVVVRNQVASIIGLLAWGFVVENLLFAFVPSVGRFGPVHAQDALTGLTTEHLLPAAAGGAVLLVVGGRPRRRRRCAGRATRRQLAAATAGLRLRLHRGAPASRRRRRRGRAAAPGRVVRSSTDRARAPAPRSPRRPRPPRGRRRHRAATVGRPTSSPPRPAPPANRRRRRRASGGGDRRGSGWSGGSGPRRGLPPSTRSARRPSPAGPARRAHTLAAAEQVSPVDRLAAGPAPAARLQPGQAAEESPYRHLVSFARVHSLRSVAFRSDDSRHPPPELRYVAFWLPMLEADVRTPTSRSRCRAGIEPSGRSWTRRASCSPKGACVS